MNADDRRPRFGNWLTPVRFALLLWALAHAMIFANHWPETTALLLGDTDDAMRMVQVRDLIAGQNWWDLTQYRINPAGGGVQMHWSRIVDIPLAGGILLLRPLIDQPLAEQVVMALWPPLLLSTLFIAVSLGFRGLSDWRIAWAAPLYLIFCIYIIAQFRPLRIDHHSWQILLAMLILWHALRPVSRGAGLFGGLFAAMLLAVSIEGGVFAGCFAAIVALRWALGGGAAERARLIGYMTGLAGGAVLLQFATRGPAGLVGRWCDSLSAPYLVALVVAAAGTAGVVALRPERRIVRFLLLGAVAALAAVALVGTAPECARGPFATLDPIVVQYWYRTVLEGQPVWASGGQSIVFVVVPSLLGLVGTLLAWRSARTAAERRDWITIAIALTAAALLSLLVLRSVSTAHLFALPGCAWIGLRIWDRARALRAMPLRLAASALAIFSLPLFASMAVAVPLAMAFPFFRSTDQGVTFDSVEGACLDPANIAALDRLDPAVILAPIDLGAPLLFWTHHSVVATPHHRNREAMADTIRAFVGDPDAAETLVRRQRATLVVVCRGANDFGLYRRGRRDGLAAQLAAGRPPAWLEPLPIGAGTGLGVWRVRALPRQP